MIPSACWLLLCSLILLGTAFQAKAANPADSVVKVLVTVSFPNPIRPWMKGRDEEGSGTRVVIEGKKILTNAHLVQYAREVHVQARPGADKLEAKVMGLGTDIDLAVLSLTEEFSRKSRRSCGPKCPRCRITSRSTASRGEVTTCR